MHVEGYGVRISPRRGRFIFMPDHETRDATIVYVPTLLRPPWAISKHRRIHYVHGRGATSELPRKPSATRYVRIEPLQSVADDGWRVVVPGLSVRIPDGYSYMDTDGQTPFIDPPRWPVRLTSHGDARESTGAGAESVVDFPTEVNIGHFASSDDKRLSRLCRGWDRGGDGERR
jgi:hypothetical protein